MASTHVQYDPALFSLRRVTGVSSQLGSFLVGVSKLGHHSASWVPIQSATFNLIQSYSPMYGDTTFAGRKTGEAGGTLIVEAETATVALSWWDEPGDVLYPGDRIEAYYAGERIFRGTVDSTSLTYTADPEAVRYGATRRVDFTCTAAGTYAILMGRVVTWKSLPAELAITRIRRWITVSGW